MLYSSGDITGATCHLENLNKENTLISMRKKPVVESLRVRDDLWGRKPLVVR